MKSTKYECDWKIQELDVVVQLLSRVRLFATPWTAARQASLSCVISQSLLELTSIESVMPSSHLILCHPLLLPSIFPNIRVFSNDSVLRIRWPKYWSFSFSISPSKEHPGLISFRMDCLEMNKNENKAYQNLWNTAKAMSAKEKSYSYNLWH